jgi:predicted N-formylglutamate amidohydrolase
MAETNHFLITCEHGGNRVPPRYRHLFRGFEALLQTHRGYDAGALTMARGLARALAAPLVASTTSRLLIDLNRSIGHPRLYSEATRGAPDPVRREILEQYYLPYRNRAEAEVARAAARGRQVIHISAHSFTPELDGKTRDADIGLLYDPARPGEAGLCDRWRAALRTQAPELKVRRNYPYAGRTDGFTAYLRRRFPADVYVGIELEINQKHVFGSRRRWRALREAVIAALHRALAEP